MNARFQRLSNTIQALPWRRIMTIALCLLVYAIVQTAMAAPTLPTFPAWMIFLAICVSEFLRGVLIIPAIYFLVFKGTHFQNRPAQILFATLAAAVFASFHIALDGVTRYAWAGMRGVELMLPTIQWLFLQETLEHGVIIGVFMLTKYKNEFIEREQREREILLRATEIELATLKAQLNPHFLFNALNSLQALISTEPDKAECIVDNLANLLRYALYSSHAQTVSLEEECIIVENYLELESIRFEERLQTVIDIEPTLWGIRIPPMMIQTLVENAVKHGISTRPEGGSIGIFARLLGNKICIRVCNDGKLKSLNNVQNAAVGGVGVMNTIRRLELLYGAGATFSLRQAGEQVIAEISLPANSVNPQFTSVISGTTLQEEHSNNFPQPNFSQAELWKHYGQSSLTMNGLHESI